MEAWIGSVILWPILRIPEGWLPCDGRKVPIAQYQMLYSLIGTTYGGNGSTDFALPDMRGRLPLGYSAGGVASGGVPGISLGKQGGAISASVPLQEHTHPATTVATSTLQVGATGTGQTVTPDKYLVVSGPGQVAAAIYQSTDPGAKASVQGVKTDATTTVAATGTPGVQQISTVNPYLAMQFIICADSGLYPTS